MAGRQNVSDSIALATAAGSGTARQARDTYEMTFKILFLDKLGKCEDEKILLNRSWKMKKLKKKFENHNT